MIWNAPGASLLVLFYRIVLLTMVLSGLGLTGLGIDIVRHGIGATDKRPIVHPFGVTVPAEWPPLLGILVTSCGIFLIAMVRGVLFYNTHVREAELVQLKLIAPLRTTVYDKLQRLSFRFFDQSDTGSIINRVTGDCAHVGKFVETIMFQLVDLVLTLAVSLFYMLSIHKRLTLATLATLPIIWLVTINFARAVRPAYRINRERVDKLILTLAEYLSGIHVVKGFARQKEQVAHFESRNADVRDQASWIYRRVTVFQPLVSTLTQANMVILLAYGGYLVYKDELPLGTGLIVFAGLLQQFSNQINMIANFTNTIQLSLTSASRVFEIMDTPLEIQSKPGAVAMPRSRGHVRFEDVSFGYHPTEPVLRDINLDVQAGQCVAILGATGAGKSTLLSLIPRFYDPTAGRLMIDGVDARDIEVDDLRRNIGIVFQENFLFSTTVAKNIAFGHPNATAEQIENAARIASAHDFIMKLPKGYDTRIGENGSDLSGGQRQRLAIARAILLEPAILILDDATAAIDPQTEHEILQAMDNAMKGRTTFVVAHRLSTLRRSDMVIVLDKGQIVQIGSHDELMNSQGHYRRAAKLQIADAESKRILGITTRY